MADEIAQAVQIELEGTKIFIKGSMQLISWLAKAISSLIRVYKDKVLYEPGECSTRDIIKMSGGVTPPAFEIDEKYKNEFLDLVIKNKLHYSLLIDFDLTDGKIPILVPANEAAAFTQIIEAFTKKKLSEEEAALKKVQGEVDELKEKLLSTNDNQKFYLETKLENVQQSKNELMAMHENTLKTYDEKNYAIPLERYLSKAKGTEFERDPDKAVAEYNKGVVIARDMDVKDCMQPIRSPYLVPVSKVQYYVPNKDITIERTYHEDNGIIYSKYSFKTRMGEMYEFSDKDMTRDKWNNEELPKILDIAGIVDCVKCKIFEKIEQVKAYFTYFDKTPPLSESRNVVFSNAEVISEAEFAIEEKLKGMASAKVIDNRIEFVVPQDKLFSQNGKVVYAPDGLEGTIYMFEHITPGALKDGMLSFSTGIKSNVVVKEKNSMDKSISAEAVKNIISENRVQVAENIKNTISSLKR